MGKEIYILGGYQTDFARNWHRENKHVVAMMREVYLGSTASTCVPPNDIDSFFIGNFAAELYCRQGHLGGFCGEFDPVLRGLPAYRIEAACASGSLAALSAMAFIKAGMYDVTCVIGVEKMKTVSPEQGGEFLGTAAWYEREAEGIEFPFPKLFGKLGDAYATRYGLDEKYLGRIAEVNYSNAKRNPNAQTRDWFMNNEHACSISADNSIVGGMIKVTDCSQITDGAACVFLASEKYASNYAKKNNICLDRIPRIQGWGHTTAAMEFSVKMAESEGNPYILPHTRQAIKDAFMHAGIDDCWSLDCIETHDCFTTSEYMAIDHFGLTAPGESWKAIESGMIKLGGKLPINPSGGLIGCGHPVGATGVRQLLDAYKQVAGTAGTYQVNGARKVGILNIGGSATTNVCMIVGL